METITCKNCGHLFEDRFCNHCGQKNFTEKDKSFKHLLEEILHFMTHFEGSFLHTLKTIVAKPGQMALDYCEGKRKIYYKPISFFLLVVVIYLLFPMARGMNPDMLTYRSNRLAGHVIQGQIKSRLESSGLSGEQLSEKFHAVSSKISKILLLLLIPLTCTVMFMLYPRRKSYVFDYAIVATEFNSFIIMFFFVLLPLLIFPLLALFHIPEANTDTYIEPFLAMAMLAYTTILFHRFFRDRWLPAILKSMAFCMALVWLVIPLYQLVIFEISLAVM